MVRYLFELGIPIRNFENGGYHLQSCRYPRVQGDEAPRILGLQLTLFELGWADFVPQTAVSPSD